MKRSQHTREQHCVLLRLAAEDMDAGVQGLLDRPAWIVASSLCSYNLGGDPGPPPLWTPVLTWINSPARPCSAAQLCFRFDGNILSDWAAQVPAFIVRLRQTGGGRSEHLPPLSSESRVLMETMNLTPD